MNINNFNSIDKIKTPEEWKAKALNIPCTQIKKSDIKQYSFYRLATSLCLTIVCLISIALFVHMNKALLPNNIIVNRSSESNATITETEKYKSDVSNHKKQNTKTDSKDFTAQSEYTLEPSETTVRATIFSTDSPKPTITTPTASIKPTTITPTNPTTTLPATTTPTPTTSTEIETTIFTEIPTQKPTSPPPKTVVFNGSVKVEGMWVNNIDVYCKILDSNGNLLGSNNLFDEQHEAEYMGEINNVEYYRYCASEKGLTFTQGYYTYVFYSRNGTVVCSGTQYVS